MPSIPSRVLFFLSRAPLRNPIKSHSCSLAHPPPSLALVRPFVFPAAPSMPVSPFRQHHRDDDALVIALAASDMSLGDQSPFLAFDDSNLYDNPLSDSSHMIFDFDDPMPYETKPLMSWDSQDYGLSSYFPGSPESTSSQLDYGASHLPPHDRSFGSGMLGSYNDAPQQQMPEFNYSHWLTDPEIPPPPMSSAPIDIPFPPSHSSAASSFAAHSDNSSIFPDVSLFSPTTAHAALQPLPRSFSPGQDSVMGTMQSHTELSMSPSDPSLSPPMWAAQLWASSSPAQQPVHIDVSPIPRSPLADPAYDPHATQRPRTRTHSRRSFPPVSDMFQSASAPTMSPMHPPLSRSYSRRAESSSEHDDRDATVRKKKRSLVADEEDHRPVDKGTEG